MHLRSSSSSMHHPGQRAAAAAMVAAARPLSVRAVVMVLLVLGLAAAALALFTMTLIDPADTRFLVFCGTTGEDMAADLRDASVLLLLSAATQALAAALALLVPWRALAVLACAVAARTGYQANVVVHRVVVGCHGHVQGAFAFLQYWLFLAVELATFLAILVIASFGKEQ